MDKMIGDFFIKLLKGAQFRRFCNIIMNYDFDEDGPVDVDDLARVHNEKMERKIKWADDSNSTDTPTNDYYEPEIKTDTNKLGSQECVGNQSDTLRANVHIAHKKDKCLLKWTDRSNHKISSRTYAQVVAE